MLTCDIIKCTLKMVIIMLGIDDPYIWMAYVLCIISALGCIAYGLLKWNEEEQEGL
jgi:hypothetical protein